MCVCEKITLVEICQATKECNKCGKRHPPSICKSEQAKGQQQLSPPYNSERPPEGETQPNSSSKVLPGQPLPNKPATMYIDATTSILLQTAKAKGWSKANPKNNMNVRILLDSGSQRSYVTSRVKNKLNLPVTGSESHMINTFGSTSETTQNCDIVSLSVGNDHNNGRNLKTYVVPTICAPINNQATHAVQSTYEHLRGLRLANCNEISNEFEVDVLIGSDQYWNIVTGKVVQEASGPTATGTKLAIAFVLSGPVGKQGEITSNLACAHVLKCSTLPSTVEPPTVEQLKSFWELEGWEYLQVNPLCTRSFPIPYPLRTSGMK